MKISIGKLIIYGYNSFQILCNLSDLFTVLNVSYFRFAATNHRSSREHLPTKWTCLSSSNYAIIKSAAFSLSKYEAMQHYPIYRLVCRMRPVRTLGSLL